jgi:hypothetical protein
MKTDCQKNIFKPRGPGDRPGRAVAHGIACFSLNTSLEILGAMLESEREAVHDELLIRQQ